MAKTGSKHIDTDSMTDKELVENSIRNIDGAFATLVMRYNENLINFISIYITVKEDAEDIMQESFKRAFNSLDKYDDKYAFSTWLYNIAKNAAIDHYRRSKNTPSSSALEVESDLLNSPIIDDSPEDNLIMNQTVEEILSNIEKLSPKYKRVAQLRFIQEYAYEEIAKELNLPINTVRTRIKRAKEQLQFIIRDK